MCERELRDKTEEVEKLKLELKDIKEILKLKDELKENGLDESAHKEEEAPINENRWSSVSRRNKTRDKTGLGQTQDKSITCTKCEFQSKSRIEVIKHVNIKHPSKIEEFNCYDCHFQGTTATELRKHRDLKHAINKEMEGQSIQCKVCGETFSKKWDLMRHRKDKHIHSVAPCRNEISGSCSYSAKMCWWKHDDIHTGESDGIKCFVCEQTFESKQNNIWG